MQKFDTIIIGSGAGGLSAAVCLARAGQQVAVIEQHYVPGGWCHSFYIDGHRYSPGVHYIGSIDKGEAGCKLYEGLGIANDLVFFRMKEDAYEHCWIGDKRIDLPAGTDSICHSLAQHFPKEKKNIRKYLNLVSKVSQEIQLISNINGFWQKLTIFFRARHLFKYGIFSLKRVIGWHIKDPLLKTVLNIQCGDHGLPPSKASFPFHCALMQHYVNGGFYPMGGGAALVKAMTNSIKNHGGQIKTGKAVKRILLEDTGSTGKQEKEAIGVELQDGEIIYATRIISNADPAVTFNLVGHENLSVELLKKIQATRYSVSSLMFFISVDMDVREAGLDSGNIWFMAHNDMDEIYDNLARTSVLKHDEFESLFISCSSLKDPLSFNGRHHTLEVVTFIDYDSFRALNDEGSENNERYEKIKERLSEKLMNTFRRILPSLYDNIIQVTVGTPTTNEYYINATRGSVYGTEKGFRQTGPFSYKSKTEIKNLFLCGASTVSHGVTGSSYSGVKTAAEILNCSEEELLKNDSTQHLRVYDAEDCSEWPGWLHEKIANRKKRFEKKTGNRA